jgi:RNA polymerase sigma-70 factor, ECF subfamily
LRGNNYKLTQIEEDSILLEIKSGNEKSFEKVFKIYYEPLCRHAFRLLDDKDEAEDLVQNMFVKYWEKRETTEITTSLKSYLYKSVHNLSLNNLKHQKVKNQYEQHNILSINGSSKNENFAYELEGEIQKSIESLPPQCKIIFSMSRFEELKYREIADALDISEKTVENQMGKALKIMREKLKAYLPLIITFLLTIINFKN